MNDQTGRSCLVGRREAGDEVPDLFAGGPIERRPPVGVLDVALGPRPEQLLDLGHVALGRGEQEQDVHRVGALAQQRLHLVVGALHRQHPHVVEVLLDVVAVEVVPGLAAVDAGALGVLVPPLESLSYVPSHYQTANSQM